MLDSIIEKMKENKIATGLVAAGLLVGGGFLLLNRPEETSPTITQLAASVTSSTSSAPEQSLVGSKASSEKEIPSTIMVDVKGAVQKAGLYELPSQSRVADAIKAAGGMTDQADPKSINLAQKLSDEAVIYVATVGEEVSVIPATATNQTVSGSSASSESEKINLNTASVEDLQTISGIGEKRAQDIIAYRDSHGGFQSVDDLANVSGIGEKTLDKLRNYVTVD